MQLIALARAVMRSDARTVITRRGLLVFITPPIWSWPRYRDHGNPGSWLRSQGATFGAVTALGNLSVVISTRDPAQTKSRVESSYDMIDNIKLILLIVEHRDPLFETTPCKRVAVLSTILNKICLVMSIPIVSIYPPLNNGYQIFPQTPVRCRSRLQTRH